MLAPPAGVEPATCGLGKRVRPSDVAGLHALPCQEVSGAATNGHLPGAPAQTGARVRGFGEIARRWPIRDSKRHLRRTPRGGGGPPTPSVTPTVGFIQRPNKRGESDRTVESALLDRGTINPKLTRIFVSHPPDLGRQDGISVESTPYQVNALLMANLTVVCAVTGALLRFMACAGPTDEDPTSPGRVGRTVTET